MYSNSNRLNRPIKNHIFVLILSFSTRFRNARFFFFFFEFWFFFSPLGGSLTFDGIRVVFLHLLCNLVWPKIQLIESLILHKMENEFLELIYELRSVCLLIKEWNKNEANKPKQHTTIQIKNNCATFFFLSVAVYLSLKTHDK